MKNKIEYNMIYNEDCLVGMKKLPNSSIDLVVTSPPYDNLRRYDGIDFTWSREIWEPIIAELFRIIKDGCCVVWVVGDATINGSETGTSFRQALYFMECGFLLHDTMIFQKKNPIPQNHNRYEQCFEYIFVFSKGKPKIFNPVMVESLTFGKMNNWGGDEKLKWMIINVVAIEILILFLLKKRKDTFKYILLSCGGRKDRTSCSFPIATCADSNM